MAETLRTLNELLALFPDNTSGLIDAEASRDLIVSVAASQGFLEDDQATFALPITDGVFVPVNPEANPGVGSAFNRWQLDANNAMIPDYGTTVVNPGHTRLVPVASGLLVEKIGGGTETYDFEVFEGGVPTGIPIRREIQANIETAVLVTETFVYDVAQGLPIDIRVSGIGTGDDLVVHDFRQRVSGLLL